MKWLTRDFVENFIRLNKKRIIKVTAGVLIVIMAFVVFCIREGGNDSQKLILSQSEALDREELAEERLSEIASVEEGLKDGTTSDCGLSLQNIIYVDVSGAVNKPYVYELEEGARVYEAIAMAGGFTEQADPSNINLAQVLKDQDKIMVSTVKELKSNPSLQAVSNGKSQGITNAVVKSEEDTSSQLININTADSNELQKITGIGPSTAEKIIEYRNQHGKFNTIEELMNVSGIGEKTFAKFKSKITV